MKVLDKKFFGSVAGGSTPGLACVQTANSSTTTGNVTQDHSTIICQTSSGLSLITNTDTIRISGDIGFSAAVKALFGEAKGDYQSTTTEVISCKPNGDCAVIDKRTSEVGDKRSDASEQSFENVADFDINDCGGVEWASSERAGGEWASGEWAGGDWGGNDFGGGIGNGWGEFDGGWGDGGGGTSRDGSLAWDWTVLPDGSRRFWASVWDGRSYKVVIDDRVPAPPK